MLTLTNHELRAMSCVAHLTPLVAELRSAGDRADVSLSCPVPDLFAHIVVFASLARAPLAAMVDVERCADRAIAVAREHGAAISRTLFTIEGGAAEPADQEQTALLLSFVFRPGQAVPSRDPIAVEESPRPTRTPSPEERAAIDVAMERIYDDRRKG